jgi:hypothetical protein
MCHWNVLRHCSYKLYELRISFILYTWTKWTLVYCVLNTNFQLWVPVTLVLVSRPTNCGTCYSNVSSYCIAELMIMHYENRCSLSYWYIYPRLKYLYNTCYTNKQNVFVTKKHSKLQEITNSTWSPLTPHPCMSPILKLALLNLHLSFLLNTEFLCHASLMVLSIPKSFTHLSLLTSYERREPKNCLP